MRHRPIYLIYILCLTTVPATAQTQVSTGLPPFGSFGGGPDTVNLGNLNVHFAIPVLHKAGRGMPFNYDFGYDSSVWYPVAASGTLSWQPVLNWGWRAQTEMLAGYVTYSEVVVTCLLSGHPISNTILTYWAYHDPRGVVHPFVDLELNTSRISTCGPSSGTATAIDGSGYTLSASYTSGTVSATVFPKSGGSLNPPVLEGNGAANITDSNGNEITVNSSGQFFDTLSSTTPVLTVSGTGSASSPATFSYTAPSGATATYTVNYTQYTVATNFGVSGTSEYPSTANSLVSSISLPDGTSYSFTYEATPGSCTPLSGTFSTNCITGRLASVTLPTGGAITYTYSGGSNGIESDGSTAGLTRALSATTTAPAQSWSYSRALQTGSAAVGPGSTWTTTVVDPAGSNTVINFAENGNTGASPYNLYETQRQIYQGSVSTANLLATSIRCYNAIYASCSTATVSTPITQTDVYSELPNGQERLSETVYNKFGLVTDDKEYNFGVPVGSAPGTTNLVLETATTYGSYNGSGCTALGNEIVNLPCQVIVSDWTSHSAVTLASSSYTYDGSTPTPTSSTPQHVSITGSRGNLTTSTTSTSSSASLNQTFTYFDTGTPNVTADVNGTTTTTYAYSTTAQGSTTASCGNSFPTGVTVSGSSVNLSTSTVWNCTGGVATQTADANGNNVSSSYTDPDFWRPASVTDQMSNQTNLTYSETAAESSLIFNSSKSTIDYRATVDGFGRPILSQQLQGPSATYYDTTETDYNNLGQPDRSTMPFSAAAGGTNSTAPGDTTTYDALGRVLTVTNTDGGKIAYTYTNNDVLQVASGTQTFQKQLEYDGLGRLTSVCEISSTLSGVGTCGQMTSQKGYWTKYTYDALGHLLTVTQNAQAATASQQRANSHTTCWGAC